MPREWTGDRGLVGLLDGERAAERRAVEAVHRLLELAADRYSFGLEGLCYLRSDCRRAIEIAARCYAEIGALVIAGEKLSRERAVVPLWRKIRIALRVYGNRSGVARPQLAFTK